MKPEHKRAIVLTLRWLAFLPLAMAAGAIGYAFMMFSFGAMGARAIPLFDEFAANAVCGFAFVFAGARIAPHGQLVVSLILVVLFSVSTGLRLVGPAAQQNNIGLVGLMAGLIGAGMAFFSIYNEEKDKKGKA